MADEAGQEGEVKLAAKDADIFGGREPAPETTHIPAQASDFLITVREDFRKHDWVNSIGTLDRARSISSL